MPTDWTYHADGVRTAVQAKHALDGTLKRVEIQLDTFKVRRWTEDVEDIKAAGKNPDTMHYDEETDTFEEYSDGANATLRFAVSDNGVARLSAIEPEDGEAVEPRHMALFPASKRVLNHLDGVASYEDPLVTLADVSEGAERSGVHIDALDTA